MGPSSHGEAILSSNYSWTTQGPRAFATVSLLSVAVGLAPSHAHAQEASATVSASGDVTLQRDPPFDTWCVAPKCTTSPTPRPSLLKLPASIQPRDTQGWAERALKRSKDRGLGR